MNLDPHLPQREHLSHELPLKPGDAFVAICDWKGVVRWLSNHTIKTQVGDLGWSNMIPDDAERFKEAFARVATLHERHSVEIASRNGLRYQIWLWSVGTPEFAVCTFNLLIPSEVEKLTPRERELMSELAMGHAVKQIAQSLDVSVNTLHAHMRNIKSKLKLKTSAEIVSFAARFFHHQPAQQAVDQRSANEPKATKRSTKERSKRKKSTRTTARRS